MLFLPIPIEITDLGYVGSTAVDFIIDLAVALFDFVSGTGSSTAELSSVSAES